MPSNVDISITDGHFGLTPRVIDHKQHLPIDIFMRSLAEVRKSQAIGVILSGTASDGTAGIEAIRAEGGVTFAQNPETAILQASLPSPSSKPCRNLCWY